MKIDISEFKVKLARKRWWCLCKQCGQEWLWLVGKPIDTKEPLDVVCEPCRAKLR